MQYTKDISGFEEGELFISRLYHKDDNNLIVG